MKNTFKLTLIVLLCTVISGNCNILNKKSSNEDVPFNWEESTYIDSLILKMPRVQIISDELKLMLDKLIFEASTYEPLREYPNYPTLISVLTNVKPNNFIKLSIGKTYIMTYCFPDAEKNNPFYPDIFPLIPSKLGVSNYKGFQVDFMWSMKYFNSNNDFNNPKLVQVEQDSSQFTAYALRMKNSDEWVYDMPMPRITMNCEVVGNNLVFRDFKYYDGGFK